MAINQHCLLNVCFCPKEISSFHVSGCRHGSPCLLWFESCKLISFLFCFSPHYPSAPKSFSFEVLFFFFALPPLMKSSIQQVSRDLSGSHPDMKAFISRNPIAAHRAWMQTAWVTVESSSTEGYQSVDGSAI